MTARPYGTTGTFLRVTPMVTTMPYQHHNTQTRFTSTHTVTRMPTSTQTGFVRVGISISVCTLTRATKTLVTSTSTATRAEWAPPVMLIGTVTQMAGSDGIAAMRMESPIDGSSVPRRVCVEEFAQDGECILYSAVRDEASALNRTATEIWQLCDGSQNIGAIAAALATRYGVDPELMIDDVSCALRGLRARGLIEFTRGTAAATQ